MPLLPSRRDTWSCICYSWLIGYKRIPGYLTIGVHNQDCIGLHSRITPSSVTCLGDLNWLCSFGRKAADVVLVLEDGVGRFDSESDECSWFLNPFWYCPSTHQHILFYKSCNIWFKRNMMESSHRDNLTQENGRAIRPPNNLLRVARYGSLILASQSSGLLWELIDTFDFEVFMVCSELYGTWT